MANLPVPSPRTFQVNEVETGANLNSIRDALNFLLNPPHAVLTQTAVQSINSGGLVAVQFDGTTVDSYGGHSNTTNNTRYTAQVAGWYWVHGATVWTNNGTSNRGTELHKNASASAFGTQALPAGSTNVFTAVAASGEVQLAVGDYVELWAFQDTGAAINTHAGSYLDVFWMHA